MKEKLNKLVLKLTNSILTRSFFITYASVFAFFFSISFWLNDTRFSTLWDIAVLAALLALLRTCVEIAVNSIME